MRPEVGEALMKLFGDRLTSERGARTVFSDLSFEVESGETLLLLGPNGAGKTTLIRMIAGLLQPERGHIRLQGGHGDRTLGEQCHYVGHLNAVKLSLTVAENVAFWSRFLGGAAGRISAALEAFGLSALRDIPAGYLSAGQKRRLGLARLLLAERPIWLLDEPMVSLDGAAQEIVTRTVNAFMIAGGLVVAATHASLGFSNSRQLHIGPPA
jgi:heme exporter protein A